MSIEKSKFLVLQGLPASGKSTYAEELSKQGWLWCDRDSIREDIIGGIWTPKLEKKVIKQRNENLIRCLNSGLNIVVDETHLNPTHIRYYKEILKLYPEYEMEIKFFDIPLDQCIKRDAKREKQVGRDVIGTMWLKYLQKPLEQDINLPNVIIVDIDGTVAQKHPNRNIYDYSKVEMDIPIKNVCNIVKALSKQYKIIFVSGRDMMCYDQTSKWIKKHIVDDFLLFMRADDDKRDDSIVKFELFENNIKNKYYVNCVLDDRNRVVDMWRTIGITTFQVNYGNF